MLLVAAALGAGHEMLVAQPQLYLQSNGATIASGLALAAIAGAYSYRRRSSSYVLLSWLLSACAVLVPATAIAVFWGFGRGQALFAPLVLSAALTGALLSAAVVVAARSVGKTLARLDAAWRIVNPFHLLALAIGCGVGAGLSAGVGALRSALALGMVLSALAAWSPSLGWYLDRRPQRGAGAARASSLFIVLACAAAFFGAELLIPMRELHAYPNPVVYYRETDRQRFTVTSGQAAFELRVDGKLTASTVDEARYFEALVQPSLAVARRRDRVLLLGGGTGLAEREVLRHADVQSLTVVVVDRALVDLSREMTWLSRRAKQALGSAKVRVVEREPIVWLSETTERFDVAVVDLPDPEGYLEGKSYSRYFYRALAAHLEPGGVAAIQAMSPFDVPNTFHSIVATVEAAGLTARPYHAAVPTIGDWGFILAFAGPAPTTPMDGAAPFLSGVTVHELGYLPKDLRAKSPVRASVLHDQRVVDSLHDEHPN